MLCERCKINQATYKKIRITNSSKSEVNLCNQCAIETGELADDSIGSFLKAEPFKSRREHSEKTCPTCGFNLKTINQKGQLGCGTCYEVFKEELRPMLKKIHGKCTHSGCIPSNRIMDIKREMQKAIEREDFERAAILRDKIKELEEGE